MRVHRSQSRRIPNVATAGWFTVLKAGPRTVPLRPPGGYRVLAKSSGAAGSSAEASQMPADRPGTTKIRLIGDSGMLDRGRVRMAVIVLGAVSFTYFILWWIMRGHL
jgi:hypothetical protein